MSKLGHGLTTVSILGVLSAALTGCPVWSEGDATGSGDSGVVTPTDVPVTPPPPTSCTTDSQCTNGYCNQATHTCVSSQACSTAVPCAGSNYCDSRGVCVPGCSSDANCTQIASGLVCNTTTHRCGPSGGCTSDAQCAATPSTPVCLGGSCQARSSVCQFDYQCTGSGQACVDGRCVVGCTAANAATVCGAGQVCTNSRCAYPAAGDCASACPTGQLCVSGACLRTCSTDATCGTGNMCDHGVCRIDTRPRPFCTMDSQCNTDSICYNGACRRLCPMPAVTPDGDCMRVDVQFNLCRADGMGRSLCTNTNEQMPQCARSADCTAGRMCVNARCQ